MPELLQRDQVQGHLYSPNGLRITKRGMCNTTRVVDPITGILHDYIRAIGDDGRSRIMHAEVEPDGLTVRKLHKQAVLLPGDNTYIHDTMGCEDPHAILWKNPKSDSLEVLLLYVGFDGRGHKMGEEDNKACIVAAISRDFHNFTKIGEINNGGIPDKDCVPFYNGNLYLFRRPMYPRTNNWPIVISELDLDNLRVNDIGKYNPKFEWEMERMGAAYAFLHEGNVVVGYHGVQKIEKPEVQIYSKGMIVADGSDLAKECYRTKEPVLRPLSRAERLGFTFTRKAQHEPSNKRIVLPSGFSIHGRENPLLRIVYGAGDRYTETASAPLHRLMEQVMNYNNRVN
jgi:predicted GH43/DUF377 family glycosyl hydrolase